MKQAGAHQPASRGQDGSYLAGAAARGAAYEGVRHRASARRRSTPGASNEVYQDPHEPDYRLQASSTGDLNDGLLAQPHPGARWRPDESLQTSARQSHVARCPSDIPEYTAEGHRPSGTPCALLEAIRESDIHPRFYQASSVGAVRQLRPRRSPRPRPFPPRPARPDAVGQAVRLLDHHQLSRGVRPMLRVQRDPLQPRVRPVGGETFVSRKVNAPAAGGASAWGLPGQSCSSATSTARRDWGFAGGTTWRRCTLMLQAGAPRRLRDRQPASATTVRDFLDHAFRAAPASTGTSTWRSTPRYFRPDGGGRAARGDMGQGEARLLRLGAEGEVSRRWWR